MAGGKREAISLALFNLLNASASATGAYKFGLFTRRAYAPDDSAVAANVPLGMVLKVGEDTQRRQTTGRGLGLVKYQLEYVLLVYDMTTTTTNPQETDETRINALLDILDFALTPSPPGERQTLGGLVEDAWFEGRTEIAQAILDEHIVISIPIHILAGRLQVMGTP